MTIHRIVPNLRVKDPGAGQEFYGDFLGLQKGNDLGWIVPYLSPENRNIQISLVSQDATAREDATISVGSQILITSMQKPFAVATKSFTPSRQKRGE